MPNRHPAVLLVLVALGLSACVLANHNLREVARARFYRSGQMSAEALRRNAESLGIRTIVNLRGRHPEERWWRDEVAVADALGIAHHDLFWSALRPPDPDSLAAFIELVHGAEEPILVHCQAGVHRAAMGSAVFLLVEGKSLSRARGQLGLFFLDAGIGDLLDLYEGSDLPFERWVVEAYPALYDTWRAKPRTPGLVR